MKKIILILSFFLFVIAGYAQIRIVNAKNGKAMNIEEMANNLKEYDVIFVGEYHDNPIIHQFQRDLLPLMWNTKCKRSIDKYPFLKWLCFFRKDSSKSLVLSFEMWERDTQAVMNAFLKGELKEEEFVNLSRAWGNYDPDYKDLVLFAKEHKLPVIAANVPRTYAGKTAREGWGFADDLPENEREYIAKNLTAPDDPYKKAFLATMSGSGHVMSDASLERLYQAQCMKDDTMAESIVIALDFHKNSRVIHFNGDFHSREFLGTVSRLQSAMPKLKIAVISPLYAPEWQTVKPTNEERKSGTHLIIIPPMPEEIQE